MTTDQLRRERDAAFAAYLTLKQERQPYRVALLACIAATRDWYRRERAKEMA